ncbi:hypothetical protein LCGC14_3067030, partial [marine sediment metagenome]
IEDVNRAFRQEFGFLANPRDYPAQLRRIIETCTDMLEEEANDHNDVGEGVEDENAEET